MTALVSLAAGGLAGTFARAAASWSLGRGAGPLPWGTFAVNLSGCFLVGLFDAWGAFTTFSALIFELDAMSRQSPARAALYLAASVLAGWGLLRLGALAGGA
jgi:fluoride exporter